MPFHLFTLDKDSTNSLQQQIRKQIVNAIINGYIPHDMAIPSSRKLSQLLSVSRNTVILAYENLLDDGYIIAKERSGYYVNPKILDWKNEKDLDESQDKTDHFNWQKALKIKPSIHRNIIKPDSWQKYQYPFIYGQFDPVSFPTEAWRECTRDSAKQSAIQSWASDSILDDPFLIEDIRTHVLPRRGIWANPNEIIITLGAQHALYMATHLLLDQSSTLGIEDPGYVDIRNIAKINASNIQPLPIDDKGLIIGKEIESCDCIYVTPSHQFPTTVTMPLDRRKELLKEADKNNIFIIEDDYESEANFKLNPTPSLKSIDSKGRVIYVGSFSKAIAPGLRIGYMVANEELISEMRAFRRLMVRNVPMNNQRALALFISKGHYNNLIKKENTLYEERWHIMDEALSKFLPISSQQPTFGGTAYWVKGPDELNARNLATLALKKSILIEPGDVFFSSKSPPLNYFRLGYSSIPSKNIPEGIRLLADLIHTII